MSGSPEISPVAKAVGPLNLPKTMTIREAITLTILVDYRFDASNVLDALDALRKIVAEAEASTVGYGIDVEIESEEAIPIADELLFALLG